MVPKATITVRTEYSNPNNPTIVEVKIDGPKSVDPLETLQTPWSHAKLTKWLSRYASTGTPVS